jgi:7-cyano-7-deazaguanine reductase
MKEYKDSLSIKGIDAKLPKIEVWPNQFKGYEIKIEVPEYTSICPKTKLPDFGTITVLYMPDKVCLELKSLKYYLLAYRNLGIFYENAVNRILKDIVKATKPMWAVVSGKFNTRGGMNAEIISRYGKVPK